MKWLSPRLQGVVIAALLTTFRLVGYVNNVPINTAEPPNIDDISFVNESLFQVFTEVPFETQNTLYFTNHATMVGMPVSFFNVNSGFRLEYVDGTTGFRKPAAVINNGQGASISGDPFIFLNATNILNQGGLVAPQDGLIRITGKTVNLTRGTIDLGRSAPSNGRTTSTNFTPATGFYDLHWGVDTNSITPATILSFNGTKIAVRSPRYRETPDGLTSFQLNDPRGFVYQKFNGDPKDPTNQVIQAVFVLNGNTNVASDVSFIPSNDPNNAFKEVVVQFSGYETNVITGKPVLKQIFLTDTFASDTNSVLLTNTLTFNTFRPANFDIEWQGVGGSQSNAVVTTNLFTQFVSPVFSNGMAYSNTSVGAFYSAYKAQVVGLIPPPANLGSADITNAGGRLEVTADNLDLSNSRIQSQSLVRMKATHLVGSKGFKLEAPYIIYDLGSTNGNLNVESLASATLTRFASGTIQAFSTVFTNYFEVQVTNTDTGSTDTKHYETAFHLLMVGAKLTTGNSVDVSEIGMTSTNVTVADDITVSRSMTTSAERLTVNGTLQLGGVVDYFNFAATNAPNLRYLTNNGYLHIIGSAVYGADVPGGYESVINTGTNRAYSATVLTKNFENYGQFSSIQGSVNVSAATIKLDGNGSQISSSGSVTLTAGDMKLRGAQITAASDVTLQVANSLVDGGGDFPNHITTVQGITLATLPTTSSLLGTTLEVNVGENGTATINWPSKDFGVSRSGFVNNAALGKVVLGSQNNGLITFTGNGDGQSLYVDYLEISAQIAGDLGSYLEFLGDYTLYFGDSNLSAELLDGALDGHIRWINNANGAYSGVDLQLPDGRVIRVNRALLNSQLIDSNGNGIANAFDPNPFTGMPLTLKLSGGASPAATISWTGTPSGVYRLESAATLGNPTWQLISTVTNTAAVPSALSGQESLPAGSTARFYRVTFEP